MFIRYQHVRNTVVGVATTVVGGVAAFFGFQGDDEPRLEPTPVAVATEQVSAPRITTINDHLDAPISSDAFNAEALPEEFVSAITPAEPTRPASQSSEPLPPSTTDQDRYAAAMKVATSRAAASGKGKDVLGSSSPWKLNLYDDDKDGQWDRAKLDYDRDEVDDEKWNFKQGRWEKDSGKSIWSTNRWVHADTKSGVDVRDLGDPILDRYRTAMKIATSRADASGKGKDVLGSSSPWKLNLYDDDKDGQWDRAKLDYDRDEVDDEKWNFKQGRWEKDGGTKTWDGSNWVQ